MTRSLLVVSLVTILAGSAWAPVSASDPGPVSGRVLGPAGNPLPGVCVGFFYRSIGGGWASNGFSAAFTDETGGYESAALPVGSYNIAFGGTAENNDCSFNAMANYAEQWWDHKPSSQCSDALIVETGETATGIDATLGESTICPPFPPAIATDLAVTGATISKVPIETDYGELGYTGLLRDIAVDLANHSSVLVPGSLLEISACPIDSTAPQPISSCTNVVQESVNLAAGGTLHNTYRWNAVGWIGDVTLTATISVPPGFIDTAPHNDQRSANTYVIVGGKAPAEEFQSRFSDLHPPAPLN